MHGFFVDVSDLHSYDHDHVLPHVHLTVFELSCMVSVDGLLEWFWLDVRWFMVVLGVACNGSKWGFKGRTVGYMKNTVQCLCPRRAMRLLLQVRASRFDYMSPELESERVSAGKICCTGAAGVQIWRIPHASELEALRGSVWFTV
ncbi:hypothetical protein F511_42592 [Dorcoceras hygrometricum]|uniref:Uncharacterized protein n=1 Tax=Dorcoceras hygrometricum TaxID=472368 RepID=A0A2Z7D5C0_9LAMI|nr:hypothetical protein F511_42592 [Dorcoceras hygrometricum]